MRNNNKIGPNELSTRIRVAIEESGGQKLVSEGTGISTRTLANYVSGIAEPKTRNLVAIAQATGVAIDWLATGQGPMRPGEGADLQPLPAPADPKRAVPRAMSLCVAAYAGLYAELKIPLPPLALGELAAAAYNEIVVTGNTEEEWRAALMVVINRHRRDLVAELTANANGKRSA